MREPSESEDPAGAADPQALREPHRARLPGFLAPAEEVGLGDVIKRATSAAGVRPCGGCARRAESLNRWMVFTR